MRLDPLDLIENAVLKLSAPGSHGVKDEQQRPLARISELVSHQFPSAYGADPELLVQFADQSRAWRLLRLYFAAWKLPLECMILIRATAAYENPAITLKDACGDGSHLLEGFPGSISKPGLQLDHTA